ncbi:MAG: hypothetical protein RL497_306 [Pseudomonadota bacterium]
MSTAEITYSNGTLALNGVVDHGSVMALMQQGQKYIAQAETTSLILDWTHITYANSAALAMVLQWTRQAEASGKSILSQNAPEFLVSLARLSQLEFIFA